MQNQIAIITISSINYFAQSKTLLESAYNFHPECSYYLLLVDEPSPDFKPKQAFFKIYYAKDIGIPDFYQLAFKYDIVEFNTAVKPYFIDYLFSLTIGYQKVMYFDPDIYIFNKLNFIIDLLDNKSIVLTPHIIEAEGLIEKINSYEYSFLTHGIYNLGFIGLSRSKETFNLIKWWQLRCYHECYIYNGNSTFVDQKWMDFIPALFENVYILRNSSYNMAIWNIFERFINQSGLVNDNEPLCFFHFSSFDINCNYISKNNKIPLSERTDLQKIYFLYQKKLFDNNYETYSKVQYSYNYFDNGSKLDYIIRRYFNSFFYLYKNPFLTEGDSFYKLCKKNRLIKKQQDNKIVNEEEKRKSIYNHLNWFVRLIILFIGIKKLFQIVRFFKNYFIYLIIKVDFLKKK